MHKSLLVFEDIPELLSLQQAAGKGGRQIVEEDLSIVKDAAIVVVEGQIAWRGPRSELNDEVLNSFTQEDEPEFISLNGQTVMPAFIEPHTHMVFAGSRAEEFEWRMQGQTYQDIAAKGGGILSTVRATREATTAELLASAQKRAENFLCQGVTLLEVKSGYGLDYDTEAKILRVARALEGPDIITTYLGPHSRSPDHADLDAYLKQITDEILPGLHKEELIDRADIYIEKGFFSLEQGRRYLDKVRELGLPVTAHVEQLSEMGGTDLALEFKPQSVDHLVFINERTIGRLGASDATAVLLPASDLYMKMKYPPARSLLEAGARVALSTDFNPGTSPTQEMSLVGVLARIEMKMTLPEVIVAMTLNAASALGKQSQHGSIESGKRCDFVTLEGSWRDLFYSIGHHPITSVWKAGRLLKTL